MRSQCLFCEKCGTQYSKLEWPRICKKCHHICYLNAVSAAMAMVPVEDTLLYIQRAIEPQKGFWAMPGGYMDLHETVEQAAARELKEETGLDIDSDFFSMYGRSYNSSAGHTLIFCLANIKPLSRTELKSMLKLDLDEVYAAEAYNTKSMPSAFPLHTTVYNIWKQKNSL